MRHTPVGDEPFSGCLQCLLVPHARLIDADPFGEAGKLFGQLFIRKGAAAEDCHLGAGFGQGFAKLRAELAEAAGDDDDTAIYAKWIAHIWKLRMPCWFM